MLHRDRPKQAKANTRRSEGPHIVFSSTDQPISRKFGPHQLGDGPISYKLAPKKSPKVSWNPILNTISSKFLALRWLRRNWNLLQKWNMNNTQIEISRSITALHNNLITLWKYVEISLNKAVFTCSRHHITKPLPPPSEWPMSCCPGQQVGAQQLHCFRPWDHRTH